MSLSFYPQDTWGYVAALNIFCGEEDNEKIINALIKNPGLILSEDTGEEAIRKADDDEANDISFSDWYSYGGPEDALKSLKKLSAISGVDFGYWLCVECKHNDKNYLLEKEEGKSPVNRVNWVEIDCGDGVCEAFWMLNSSSGAGPYLGERNTGKVYKFQLKNKKTGGLIHDKLIWVEYDGDSCELRLIDGMEISLDDFYEIYRHADKWARKHFERIKKGTNIPENLTADDIEASVITSPLGLLTEASRGNGDAESSQFKTIPDCTDDDEADPEFVMKAGVLKKYKGDASSVSIPKGVTKIGKGAFDGCTALASVSIPEGVTKIGEDAFNDCTALTSVTIPASVTEIDYAFGGCWSLKEVRYGGTQVQWFMLNGFRQLPADAAVHCTDGEGIAMDMSEVVIPEGVTEIGVWAFKDCTSLASVTIPEGVTEIGRAAFSSCTALASVTIPEGVTEIGMSAFHDCTSLASVSIPGSVTEIGENAFLDCTSLVSVTIPEGVTKIGVWAFKDCTALASVTIPEGVTEIGKYAFYGCTALAEIHYAGTKAQWEAMKKENGWHRETPAQEVLCSDGTVELPAYLIEDGVLKKWWLGRPDAVIPEGVTEIGVWAFSGSKALVSVSIPEGVTEIGIEAFKDCTSLASVTIPEGVTKIGIDAFQSCKSLASVTISEGVTEIGREAFIHCTSLASVSIPASVTKIGKHAFYGCTALAEIHYTGTKEQWAAVEKGDNWNKGVPATEVPVRKQ